MGYTPYFVEGDEPESVHQQLAGVLDTIVKEIKRIWADARENGNLKRPELADDRVSHTERLDLSTRN